MTLYDYKCRFPKINEWMFQALNFRMLYKCALPTSTDVLTVASQILEKLMF